MIRQLMCFATVISCGRPATVVESYSDLSEIQSPTLRFSEILWNGSQIGTVEESLKSLGSKNLEFTRIERYQFLRDGTPVNLETHVRIQMRASRLPYAVHVEKHSDHGVERSQAHLRPNAWAVQMGLQGIQLPPDAIPAEIIPLFPEHGQPRRVFWAGRNYVLGTAQLNTSTPQQTLTIELSKSQKNTYEVSMDETGWSHFTGASIETRRIDAPMSFPRIDLVQATRLSIPARTTRKHQIHLSSRVALPSIAGQTAQGELLRFKKTRWDLPTRPASPHAREWFSKRQEYHSLQGLRPRQQVQTLTRLVHHWVQNDMRTPTQSTTQTLSMLRGDCNAHALLFVELARTLNIPAQLVVGYRKNGDQLVRHRWAVVSIDGWRVPVDPTFGESPMREVGIALAEHETDATTLATIDEIVFSRYEPIAIKSVSADNARRRANANSAR